MNKLLIICGPTAIGKTSLAVKLAKQFNGVIVSADSRQVYQGMDIVTGKDKESYQGVKVVGLDLVKPDEEYSVSHWLQFAKKEIKNIWQEEKLALVVGGTWFWLKALVEGIDSLGTAPDWQLRKKLEKKKALELRKMLKRLAPERLEQMNQSDRQNPRRLIRAIELAQLKTKLIKGKKDKLVNNGIKTDKQLIIGLKTKQQLLYQRIDQRVKARVKAGAQSEVESLLAQGYSWSLNAMSAIGYREWRGFLEGKQSLDEVIKRWQFNEHGYARRQMTWLKKAKGINWFDITDKGWQIKLVKLVKSWYY